MRVAPEPSSIPFPIARNRRGITLTEILVSIGILGVGLIALATLFPLGLLRIQSATNYNRSALLAQSAFNETISRGLLTPSSFTSAHYWPVNPFNQDVEIGTMNPLPANNATYPVFRGGPRATPLGMVYRPGGGLPVCYDPLLWAQARFSDPINPNSGTNDDDARFGNGIGMVEPLNSDGSTSAPIWGMRRVTNFLPWSSTDSRRRFWPLTFPNADGPAELAARDVAADVFASQDDPLWQNKRDGATIVPDLTTTPGSTTYEWVFSWMITGQFANHESQSVFEGDFVVHRNRVFGLLPFTQEVPGPPNAPVRRLRPAGETVVQAVFGYNVPNAADFQPGAFVYPRGDARQILLRWPASLADPDVRVGQWIADVTYQRNLAEDLVQYPLGVKYPGQRCHWYQIIRKSPIEEETGASSPPVTAGFRRMVVTVARPVEARTRWLNQTTPLHETALIMPSVVNVFPKSVPVDNK